MTTRIGNRCPVIVNDDRDPNFDVNTSLHSLMGLSPVQLAGIDPVVMNLSVARALPALTKIDVQQYVMLLDHWFFDFMTRCVPQWEHAFYESPESYHDDQRFFLLGMLSQYLEVEQGIEYNEHQRFAGSVLYLDPNDLFLCGVIDTRRGTCGNMAALHLAMAWRLGFPVSLACVNSHFVTRLDDGRVVYNFEATQSGFGGFKSDPDDFLIKSNNIPEQAIVSGSDLRALTPHEVLATFVSLRARHILDVGQRAGDRTQILRSEGDWLLARHLFPNNRIIFRNQLAISALRSESLFDETEVGHLWSFSELRPAMSSSRDSLTSEELSDACAIGDIFSQSRLDYDSNFDSSSA
ncbi:MAG: hypothetical protein FJ308_17930 [Planctomycetes bacterium]|nr:hypothetical protein [Planctomycetota bacterium]